MSAAQEALLQLTRPTKDDVAAAAGALLLQVCQSARPGDADGDAVIEASTATQPLAISLLACKLPPGAGPAPPPADLVQRAHALVCVADLVLTRKADEATALLPPAARDTFDAALVAAAWGVLARDVAAVLPRAVAAVIASLPQRAATAMIVMARRWLRDRLVDDPEARNALRAAVGDGAAKPDAASGDAAAAAAARRAPVGDSDATAGAAADGDGGGDDVALGAGSAPAEKLSAAAARERAAQLRQLCVGLEAAAPGSADAAALRAALVEYGAGVVAATGGAKRWGAAAGAEVRALAAVAAARVRLPEAQRAAGEVFGEAAEEAAAVERAAAAAAALAARGGEDIPKGAAGAGGAGSSAPASSAGASGAPGAAAGVARRPALTVPAHTSLVLDRGDTLSAVALKTPPVAAAEARRDGRGPLPAPDAVSPFAVPARLSGGGERASRQWAAPAAQWASARSSLDLPWVAVAPRGAGAGGAADDFAAPRTGASVVMPTAVAHFFFLGSHRGSTSKR